MLFLTHGVAAPELCLELCEHSNTTAYAFIRAVLLLSYYVAGFMGTNNSLISYTSERPRAAYPTLQVCMDTAPRLNFEFDVAYIASLRDIPSSSSVRARFDCLYQLLENAKFSETQLELASNGKLEKRRL